MIDLVFYSVVEVATGFAPNFTAFLVLRALFGIGMGGEWGVGASLAMEKVPLKWRGVVSGALQQGYAFGNLLASLAYLFLFRHWGWRPMFFLGGLPALLALFVRVRVKESEIWEKSKEESWSHLCTALLQHWRLFVYLVILMTGMNLASHGTQDMFPTFLQRYWHFNVHDRSLISSVGNMGAIIGGTFIGFISDRLGRRRAIISALLGATLLVPLWAYAPRVGLLVAALFYCSSVCKALGASSPRTLASFHPIPFAAFSQALPISAACCWPALWFPSKRFWQRK